MKNYTLLILSLLLISGTINAQKEHLFIYKSLISPIHNEETQQIDLTLGYEFKEGINLDASYNFNKMTFVFTSISADIFPKKKFKYNLSLGNYIQDDEYKIYRNNYSILAGVGIYKNISKLYCSLLAGISYNRVKDNVQFIVPKGADKTFTKVGYTSPLAQILLILRNTNFDFGTILRFEYNMYGDVKSYNNLFRSSYQKSYYAVNESYNIDFAIFMGLHISKIILYYELGKTDLHHNTNIDEGVLTSLFSNIGIKYNIDYKHKSD